jgi:hypothetical protein
MSDLNVIKELLDLLRKELFPNREYKWIHHCWLQCGNLDIVYHTTTNIIKLYEKHTKVLGAWYAYDENYIEGLKEAVSNYDANQRRT